MGPPGGDGGGPAGVRVGGGAWRGGGVRLAQGEQGGGQEEDEPGAGQDDRLHRPRHVHPQLRLLVLVQGHHAQQVDEQGGDAADIGRRQGGERQHGKPGAVKGRIYEKCLSGFIFPPPQTTVNDDPGVREEEEEGAAGAGILRGQRKGGRTKKKSLGAPKQGAGGGLGR